MIICVRTSFQWDKHMSKLPNAFEPNELYAPTASSASARSTTREWIGPAAGPPPKPVDVADRRSGSDASSPGPAAPNPLQLALASIPELEKRMAAIEATLATERGSKGHTIADLIKILLDRPHQLTVPISIIVGIAVGAFNVGFFKH